MSTPRPAFTLLETVISLTIVCSLTAIASFNLKDYQARVEERQALEWFKNSFKSSFNYCYLNKKAAIMYLDPESNSIEFAPEDKNTFRYQKRTFPKFLKIDSDSHSRYDIFSSGQAAPATVVFASRLTNQKYIYKIQMGWGEIVEESEKWLHSN